MQPALFVPPALAPQPGRRAFLAGAATLAALCANGVRAAGLPSRNTLAFQVCRNGSKIGEHQLDFTRGPASTSVRIDAAFQVRFGFITFYRYHHQGVEEWRDGAFHALDTTTNDNGQLFRVQARRSESGILIHASSLPDQTAPAETLPLTHWAIEAMRAPIFNPQTGKILRATAQKRGPGTIPLADGNPVQATAYALGGESPIEDWYDSSNVWTALNAVGKDGSAISYRRL